MLAGITLAAVSIPVALGYAKIAGMPVVTGLYTLLLPMAAFAVLGSSRHLVVGADSATAAILGATLAGLAAVGSPQYVRLAGLAALLAGGLLLAAVLTRVIEHLRKRHIRLSVSTANGPVREQLDRYGISAALGPGAYYDTPGEALEAPG